MANHGGYVKAKTVFNSVIQPILVFGVLFLIYAEEDKSGNQSTAVSVPASSQNNAGDSSINKILALVDQYRGLERSYIADLAIKYYENKREKSGNTFKIMIRFHNDQRDILLRYLTPETDFNNLILSRDNKMWVYTRKTSRPIPISIQQRLLGDASIGDVLDVDLRNRYAGTIENQGKTSLIKLSAIVNDALYDKVNLTIDAVTCRPVQADFQTRTGKLLKQLRFLTFTKVNGKEIASRMEILDKVETARVTSIFFSGFRFSNLPASYFEKDNLRNMQFGD
jgi:hypothetical protein